MKRGALVAVVRPTDEAVEELACATVDPELMFPEKTLGNDHPQVQEAKAVCRRCPSRTKCLEGALRRREEWGIWGGMTAREREASRKRSQRAYDPESMQLDLAV